jgi:predicted RNA-binding protein with PUA-like domain
VGKGSNVTQPHPACWLLKTEPSQYSYDDLEREGRTVWDGITNPQALRFLRAIRKGDRLLIYHTGEERAVVGYARCARAVEPGATSGAEQWIEVVPEGRLKRPVALAELKEHPNFASSPLLRQPRLSVVPLTAAEHAALEALARR